MYTSDMLKLIVFEAAERGDISQIEKEFMLEAVSGLDPIKKFMNAIEDAKEYVPLNTQESKVLNFLISYEDKILKAAKILEKEPKKLEKRAVLDAVIGSIAWIPVVMTISTLASSGVITGGALIAGIAATVALVFAIIDAIIIYVRERHDLEVLNNLIKINDKLSSLDLRKVSPDIRERIQIIIRKIDDAVTDNSMTLIVSK